MDKLKRFIVDERESYDYGWNDEDEILEDYDEVDDDIHELLRTGNRIVSYNDFIGSFGLDDEQEQKYEFYDEVETHADEIDFKSLGLPNTENQIHEYLYKHHPEQNHTICYESISHLYDCKDYFKELGLKQAYLIVNNWEMNDETKIFITDDLELAKDYFKDIDPLEYKTIDQEIQDVKDELFMRGVNANDFDFEVKPNWNKTNYRVDLWYKDEQIYDFDIQANPDFRLDPILDYFKEKNIYTWYFEYPRDMNGNIKGFYLTTPEEQFDLSCLKVNVKNDDYSIFYKMMDLLYTHHLNQDLRDIIFNLVANGFCSFRDDEVSLTVKLVIYGKLTTDELKKVLIANIYWLPEKHQEFVKDAINDYYRNSPYVTKWEEDSQPTHHSGATFECVDGKLECFYNYSGMADDYWNDSEHLYMCKPDSVKIIKD